MKNKFIKDFKYYKWAYLMALPVLAFYLLFHYGTMGGAIIAFKDYSPKLGIWGSEWIGLENFISFVKNYYFWRLLRNTLLISVYSILICFPAPILLALMLNEVKSNVFKKSVQTITYIPYFVSMVVICGIVIDFTSTNGVINDVLEKMGFERKSFMSNPAMFRPVYIVSELWQYVGFNSIIYLAAMAAINPQLYEAAYMDGASRMKMIIHITIPSIMPTIIILFILRIGNLMSVGYEKIILLYNPLTYDTADVISSFVYRKGLLDFKFSYSTAIGLFNSTINFLLLVMANRVSKRYSETSLW